MTHGQTIPDWWNYIRQHRSDITDVVRMYCNNFTDEFRELRARTQEEYDAGRPETMRQWQLAFDAHDYKRVEHMMQSAWFNAPDRRDIYETPGFTELCNLLDGTVGSDILR